MCVCLFVLCLYACLMCMIMLNVIVIQYLVFWFTVYVVIFANFTSQTLAKSSSSTYVYKFMIRKTSEKLRN